jgi:hypothetical protein
LEAELEGGLVGGQAELGEQVAALLFGGVEDLAGRGGVDGGGDVGAELLELAAHRFEEVLGRKVRLVVHRGALPRGQRGTGRRNSSSHTPQQRI